MSKRNIEQDLADEISPLEELLGKDRVDTLKDAITQMLIERVEEDIRDASQYYVVYADDFEDIAKAAMKNVKKKIQKMFEDAMLEVATKAVENFTVNGKKE